jgi:hypothetical protein
MNNLLKGSGNAGPVDEFSEVPEPQTARLERQAQKSPP